MRFSLFDNPPAVLVTSSKKRCVHGVRGILRPFDPAVHVVKRMEKRYIYTNSLKSHSHHTKPPTSSTYHPSYPHSSILIYDILSTAMNHARIHS
mmetsp:Transcript_4382/g.5590  ORF Transcript_4382/g.5590 Transcript_4382/m.5590 type:complete len:94 (-) Transcript_4382:298-579(-)